MTDGITIERLVALIRRRALTPELWRRTLRDLPPSKLERGAELLRAAPGHAADAIALTGHAAFRLKDYGLAAGALQAAVSQGRSVPEDYAALAHALAAEDRVAEAADVANALAALPDAGLDTAWVRTLIALAQGRHTEALETLRSMTMRAGEAPVGADAEDVEWLKGYLEAGLGLKPTVRFAIARCLAQRWSGAHRSADAAVIIGIMDYKSADRGGSSRNVGDTIQTVAVLRHLMRLGPDIRWSFDDPTLRGPADRLADSWQPQERTPVRPTRVHIAVVDRDNPWPVSRIHADRDVWLIVNGWFGHRAFDVGRFEPFPENVRPIFVGFHLAVGDHLDEQWVAYLKRHEPIGCRDWSTVWWLLNRGIAAFFSGCPTLTLADRATSAPRSGRLAVDLPQGASDHASREHLTHLTVTEQRIGEATNEAIDLLAFYAGLSEVTTSRLHAFLPCLALGTPVTFQPRSRSDRRLDGLDDLTHDQAIALGARLTALLGKVLHAIAMRGAPGEVRALWADLTRDAVGDARARFDAARMEPLVPGVRSQSAERAVRPAPLTVVVAFDDAYARHVAPLVRSCAANTREQIAFVFLARAVSEPVLKRLATTLIGHDISVVRTDLHPSTAFEMPATCGVRVLADRLSLPDLLPDRDRVICLDVDTVVAGDLAELAAVPLSDLGLAARQTPGNFERALAGEIERWANGADHLSARQFRVFAAASVDLWASSFDCGVLVLSLEAMRRNGLSAHALEIMRRHGTSFEVALNVAVGGRFHALPPAWNAMPSAEWVEHPKLVHFRGTRKPWHYARPPRLAELWAAHAGSGAVVPMPPRSPRRQSPSNPKIASSAVGGPAAGDAEFWANPANYSQTWDMRAARAARLIAPGAAVLDLGCGRMALRAHLPEGCRYVPADLVKWSDDVIAVDLNGGEFPEGRYDYIVMLGVLEYLRAPGDVLREACRHTDNLIVSFSLMNRKGDQAAREARRWVNHFSLGEFERVLGASGWRIASRVPYRESEQSRQMIFAATAAGDGEMAGYRESAPSRVAGRVVSNRTSE
jgi:lipopolysaccharide biosynthesis glycosyltransferase